MLIVSTFMVLFKNNCGKRSTEKQSRGYKKIESSVRVA